MMSESARSRTRFRWRWWMLVVLILIACAGWWWRYYLRSPSIRFVEYRNSSNGTVAVFRIANETKVPYTFWTFIGFAPPTSRPVRREMNGEEIAGFSGGVMHKTLFPDESVELGIIEPPKEPFRIGLKFVQGKQPGAHTLVDHVRFFLGRNTGYYGSDSWEWTWSTQAPGLPIKTN